MKGAMLMADAVTTVSPTYARELHYPYFAHGLQGVVDMVDHKLYGILNGIDVAHYNPESDPLVPYHFTIEDRTGKGALQARNPAPFRPESGERVAAAGQRRAAGRTERHRADS